MENCCYQGTLRRKLPHKDKFRRKKEHSPKNVNEDQREREGGGEGMSAREAEARPRKTLQIWSLLYMGWEANKRYTMFMDQKTAIVKLSSLPKVTHSFSTIPIQILVGTFVEIDKLILKSVRNSKG